MSTIIEGLRGHLPFFAKAPKYELIALAFLTTTNTETERKGKEKRKERKEEKRRERERIEGERASERAKHCRAMEGERLSKAVGASHYLHDLPSRGYFSSSVSCSNPGGLRVYICDHETTPPEEQLIKTDTTNILIRSLTLKKGIKESKSKVIAESSTGKRPAEQLTEEKASSKRVNTGSGAANNSRKDGGISRLSDKDLQGFTVERLKFLLKEKGLPLKGKKEELIARLKRHM
ncbi:hypothetical protein O6H91_18G018100 [Diphasiastrum complanatum]|uniref:Uncharacterized protein n=1 Tax=Diphasiastrum complanatum TaxID=34168 RepID=A0ACC2AYK8_DIPCM|nr:hypothetical protein O6H91_18G018100 [Diphasiastrum complanatum]